MMSTSVELARAIVATLHAHGVRDVVYSPGSRCAPFAYALAQFEQAGLLRVHVRIDERGAGFFAVGLSRAGSFHDGRVEVSLPRPVALIGTSGGAIAEYHAAVAEASHSSLPLIVVSADRPFEMQGVGASQTTRQVGIFADHVRDSWSIPAGITADHHVSAIVGRAVARACGAPNGRPGPVHMNVALRDPLTPDSWPLPDLPALSFGPKVHRSLPVELPWESVVDPSLRTVIIAGDDAAPEACEWAECAQIPLLAEPTSGVTHSSAWIPFQQAFLQSGVGLSAEIEQVIVTGRPTLSRPVSALLAREDVRIIVVSEHEEWPDVAGRADEVVAALGLARAPHSDADWLPAWRRLADAASIRVADLLREDAGTLTLPQIARQVWSQPVSTLVLGASNTVRAFDVAVDQPAPGFVVANRGLAGIDGTIATAYGLARASGSPVRAVMGDLTFFHDVSSLAVTAPETHPDVHIIVVDDEGGGIFASLEHGREQFTSLYPRWFDTRQEVSVSDLAAAYGAQYCEVNSENALAQELARPIHGVRVCHIRIPRPTAVLEGVKACVLDTQ